MKFYNNKNKKGIFKKLLIYLLTACLSMTGCSLIKKKDTDNKVPSKTIECESPKSIDSNVTIEESLIVTEQETKDDVLISQSISELTEVSIESEELPLEEFSETVMLEEALTEPEQKICDEMSKYQEQTTSIEKHEEVLFTDSLIEPEILAPIISEVNNKKLVALTFDDGPSKYTSELVKILEENNASATFFLIGSSIKYYPDAVKEAYLAGNEIAVHTYSHKSFTKMTIEEIVEEIETTEQLIENLDVECADMVRPPYGSINSKIIENIDTSFILWNVDTRDWESRDKEAIKKEVEKAIKEGSIILFHDTYECTIEAIKEILPLYSEEYEFVTVTELFERNQKELEDNQKYRSLTK